MSIIIYDAIDIPLHISRMVHLRIRMIIDSHEEIQEIECKTLKSSEMSLIIYIETCNREMNTIPTVNPQARKLNFKNAVNFFLVFTRFHNEKPDIEGPTNGVSI